MSDLANDIIGNHVDLISGYAFKSVNFLATESKGTLPVIKIKNVANGDVNLNDVVFHKFDSNFERFLLTKGDILIAMTGNHPHVQTQVVGEVSKYRLTEAALLNQRVGKFIPKGKTDLNFIYYLLKSEDVRFKLANKSSGSANQANLSKNDILGLEIEIPPPSEQKSIAEVLSSLDDKIDLLHRQNKTLEQMAETLFRQWFVEKGSDISVYDYFTIDYGYPFNSKLFNNEGLGLPLIRIRDIKESGSNTFTTEIADEKYLVSKGNLLVGMDGEFRIHIWKGDKSLLNQRVCRINPKEGISSFFVLFLLRPFLNFYEQTKGGTTVIHLGKSDFDEMKTSKFDSELIYRYNLICDPLYDKILHNSTTIKNLTQLRDILLPKLMNGTVRVTNS